MLGVRADRSMEPKEATKEDAVAPAAGAAAVDVGGAGAKSKPHCSSASADFFAPLSWSLMA